MRMSAVILTLVPMCILLMACGDVLYAPSRTLPLEDRGETQRRSDVIRVADGIDLPFPFPVMHEAVLKYASYDDNSEVAYSDWTEDFLIVLGIRDPVAAAWFYEGVFWDNLGVRRQVAESGEIQTSKMNLPALDAGETFVAMYDMPERWLISFQYVKPRPEEMISGLPYKLAVSIARRRTGGSEWIGQAILGGWPE